MFLTLVQEEPEEGQQDDENFAQFFGTMERTPNDRDYVGGITFNKAGTLLAAQSSETNVDIFAVMLASVAEKRFKKRQVKRERKKKKEEGKKGEDAQNDGEKNEETTVLPSDYFIPLEVVKTSGRIKSFAFEDESPTRHFMVALTNNAVDVYKVFRLPDFWTTYPDRFFSLEYRLKTKRNLLAKAKKSQSHRVFLQLSILRDTEQMFDLSR